MTSAPDRPAVRIYRKTYFGASRTWDVWNKLTASQVFDLTEQPGFEGKYPLDGLLAFRHFATESRAWAKEPSQARMSTFMEIIPSAMSTCAV